MSHECTQFCFTIVGYIRIAWKNHKTKCRVTCFSFIIFYGTPMWIIENFMMNHKYCWYKRVSLSVYWLKLIDDFIFIKRTWQYIQPIQRTQTIQRSKWLISALVRIWLLFFTLGLFGSMQLFSRLSYTR